MNPTVLLVDEEVRSLDAMRRTPEQDFEILTATDAEAAREQMLRRDVDVSLCDQRMPGTTGVEFLREARERWPDAPGWTWSCAAAARPCAQRARRS